VEDWREILLTYNFDYDLPLERKLLESLTFTRLPWLLARFIKTKEEGGLNRVDFFEAMKLVSQSPVGREIVWDYFRINFDEILEAFGEDDPRIGQLLLDICSSFENEFMFYEV
jgi:hypothetical protein